MVHERLNNYQHYDFIFEYVLYCCGYNNDVIFLGLRFCNEMDSKGV